jgi:hypothetical protein
MVRRKERRGAEEKSKRPLFHHQNFRTQSPKKMIAQPNVFRIEFRFFPSDVSISENHTCCFLVAEMSCGFGPIRAHVIKLFEQWIVFRGWRQKSVYLGGVSEECNPCRVAQSADVRRHLFRNRSQMQVVTVSISGASCFQFEEGIVVIQRRANFHATTLQVWIQSALAGIKLPRAFRAGL